MVRRIASGAVVAALALGAVGLAPVGPGAAGQAQEDRLRPGAIREATPRARAAQEIATLLREGVEADPRQVISELPSLAELAERRQQIARQLMEFALVKFLEPPSPTAQRGTFHAAIEDYVEWSSRRLDAALDLAESDDDRRDAMAREVAKMRRVEAIYRDLTETEAVGVTPQNLMELEFKRLELETRLARLVGGGE